MTHRSLNKFSVVGNDIHISRDGRPWLAFTSYREDYYDEIISRTWTLDKEGYLKNPSLGYLHRYIMRKWYGDEVFNYFTANGYVVDHMNNEGTDCRVSNLEFLKRRYNVAKGQKYDVDAKELKFRIAVNIFKDFNTCCYQISIGCNDTVYGTDSDGTRYYVTSVKLLYDCAYPIVINDAETILLQYADEGRIRLDAMHACDVRVGKAIQLPLTEEEKSGAVVVREGQLYLLLGTGHTYLLSAHFDEGWTPPPKID